MTVMASNNMKFSLLFRISDRFQGLSPLVAVSTVVWFRTAPEMPPEVVFLMVGMPDSVLFIAGVVTV